jgi:hypothetical protein
MQLVQTAARLAESLGEPALADNPQFWARVHEASVQARQTATGHAPTGTALDAILDRGDDAGGLGARVLNFDVRG